MKLVCDQQRTSEALQKITTVIRANIPNPVVLNTRLVAVDGRIDLFATDFEISLAASIEEVEVKESGEVCLPGKRLADIFRELPRGEVTITGDARGAKITTAGSRFNVLGIDPEEFPRFPIFDEADSFSVPAATFRSMVARVAFAVALDKGRYALNGVLFEVREGSLGLVGSDGKRLASVTRKLKIGKSYPDTIIVPPKGLALIERVIGDDDEVRIQVRENQLLARTGGATVTTQLVEGLYPDYKAVIPKHHDKKAVLPKDEFAAGLRRAALLTDETSMTVRFAFDTDRLTLTARSPEAGDAEVEVPIEYQDEPLEIGFDPRYLTEVVKHLEGDDIVLELKDKDSAGLIKEGREFLYVVMPTEID